MGLAAGQARLLSITGRKSDCEFQSMRISHQKIALSRELADISNEYQNSLNQTKLVYDYYGTGDTSTQLSYGLMMRPSALNDYMPITVSDSAGRIVLDNKLALAAAAAGIPQEGLGTLPSEVMRNNFILALSGPGVDLLTEDLAGRITGLPYNQKAGFGGGETVAVQTENVDLNGLMEKLADSGNTLTLSKDTLPSRKMQNAKDKEDFSRVGFAYQDEQGNYKHFSGGTLANSTEEVNLTVDKLLGDTNYMLAYEGISGEQSPVLGVSQMQQYLTAPNGFLDWLMEEFSSVLDLGDDFTGQALEYAYTQMVSLLTKENNPCSEATSWQDYWLNRQPGKDTDEETSWKNKGEGADSADSVQGYLNGSGTPTKIGKADSKDEDYRPKVVEDSRDYVGFYFVNGEKGGFLSDNGNDHATAGISLNNIAKAFLTYFADYVNGIAKTDKNGEDLYYVNTGKIENDLMGRGGSRFVGDEFDFTVKVGKEVSSSDLGIATFYDALFNQICANGWTKNEQINDNTYLQQMLQNGMMFVSRVNADGYYYQGNYATDSYIKEIPDESAIAFAEAKYNTEKAKLNSKEETLDLKMKNLDTEISSLTTEYDTVKNTISKQIEKCFKRYNA